MTSKPKSRSRGRVVMTRLVPLREADRSFDLEFWRRVGAEGRFAAMWEMVREFDLLRGGDGNIAPLRRDVVRVIRNYANTRRRRDRRWLTRAK
jgi:hypothetical protein